MLLISAGKIRGIACIITIIFTVEYVNPIRWSIHICIKLLLPIYPLTQLNFTIIYPRLRLNLLIFNEVTAVKIILRIIALTCALALLCSCDVTMNRNRMIQRVVHDQTLENQKVLKVGFQAPKSSWQCTQVAREAHNWSVERFTGVVQGGGYNSFKNRAITYANNHPELNINYAYLYIPNEVSVVGINVTMMRKGFITYYNCANPPEKHNNPFKD